MKYLTCLFAIMFMNSFVMAGDGSGKVTRLYAHSKNSGDGVIMFALERHTGQPDECPGSEWAFDANTGEGKAMYSMLLSAAALGKSVVVKGADDCAAWHDRERPLWIRLDY